jgi:hypothetical protein
MASQPCCRPTLAEQGRRVWRQENTASYATQHAAYSPKDLCRGFNERRTRCHLQYKYFVCLVLTRIVATNNVVRLRCCCCGHSEHNSWHLRVSWRTLVGHHRRSTRIVLVIEALVSRAVIGTKGKLGDFRDADCTGRESGESLSKDKCRRLR